MPRPYPLLLERTLSRRLWGGQRLAPFLGVAPPDGGDPYGESWQVYGGNRVLNGSDAGRTLAELAERDGAALLGTVSVERYGTTVPLLAKFIDAADRLSIQVHPDDAYALEREKGSGHLGKTEAWYILDADPGATVIWGFAERMTEAQIRAAVDDGTLERHLNLVEVRRGDVIFNPAGTVHAVGAGIFLFEIQQSSDLTYRLYDYNRRGADGRLRELHLDKGLEVARLEPGVSGKVSPGAHRGAWRELVRVEPFAMEVADLDGAVDDATVPESFEILTVSRGAVTLGAAGETLELAAGTSAVLPAELGPYRLEGSAEVLRCYVPPSGSEGAGG